MRNEPVVELSGLTHYYGATPAALEINLQVGRGEVFALLGPNGAGKTTVIRAIMGFLEPTRGRASLFGCDSRQLTPEVRSRVGYTAEGHPLYGWMRVREIASFTEGTHPRWNGETFAASVAHYGLKPDAKVRELSSGQRACLSVSLALSCDPELLILDDPMLGVDAAFRRGLLRGIVDLASREGRTVVITSHILSEMERIADRIGIMVGSVLRVDLPLEELRRALVRYHLTFPDQAPRHIEVPRAVSVSAGAEEAVVTIARPGPDVEAALARLGATTCTAQDLSLEDAFIDYVGGGASEALQTTSTTS